MNCPRCNHELGNTDIAKCTACGFEISVLKKTVHTAATLYGKGLEQAKQGDLQGAAAQLEKSLGFHKGNIHARNLLGLIYLETGRFGDALKQWIISASYKKENVAAEYITTVRNNARLMERYNDAVHMYNQALVYLHQNSEDMAIIQLKKAIEYNPKLIEAHNLLAFCYIYLKTPELAVPHLQQVLVMDNANSKARRYLIAIGRKALPDAVAAQKSSVTPTPPVKPVAPPKPAPPVRHLEPNKTKRRVGFFPFSELLTFFAGLACAAAVIYFLFIPGIRMEGANELENQRKELSALETAYDTDIAAKEQEIAALKQTNQTLATQNDKLSQSQAVLDKVQRFNQALSLSASDRNEEAADILKSLDVNELPQEYRAQYQTTTESLYPAVARSYYNTGLSAYNGVRYDEARGAFEKSIAYGIDGAYLVDSYYFLGRMAEAQEDFENARKYYQILVDNHSGYARTNTARTRLNNLPQ